MLRTTGPFSITISSLSPYGSLVIIFLLLAIEMPQGYLNYKVISDSN